MESMDHQSETHSSNTNPLLTSDSKSVSQKNKPFRKFTWVGVILLLVVGTWYGYKLIKPQSTGPRINPLSLIPSNTLYLIETDKPYQVWDEVSKTDIWGLLETDEEWREHGEMLTQLQETLSDFDQALDLLANRTIYISAHPYRRTKTDLLFVADFEGLSVIRTWLINFNQVTTRVFKGKTIYEQFNPETKETFYFTFEDSYLIGSNTHTLVEASISQKDKAFLTRSFDFIDVRKKTQGEGLLRIYTNYSAIYAHLSAVINSESISNIQKRFPFYFSGLHFDIDQKALKLEGVTVFNDSLSTYLNLFQNAGVGGGDIAQVAPQETSAYISFGFDSFQKFYQSLNNQLLNNQETREEFKQYTRKTEKFLNINLEKDLAGWIDDEIAAIQIELNGQSETALILKAKSHDLAVESTNYLSKQIKRKTPVRFKAVTYKKHVINYMAVKGLFNLVLGNLFKKFDRPYYTIIDQYVVFSNRPEVLRTIIDRYLDKQTLATSESYQEFINDLGENHSVLLYLQLELLKKGNNGIIDNETISYLKTKSHFLRYFPQLGFKILPDDKMFETKLLLSIKAWEQIQPIENFEQMDSLLLNYDSLFQINPGEQIVIADIEIEDLSAKKQSEKFEEGLPKYEVDIKNGVKHGNYFEYHSTGELKIKGKYKNDLKEGVWKFYDKNGKLVKKEKYRKGILL